MDIKVKELDKGIYMVKFGEKELVFRKGDNLIKLLKELGYIVEYDRNMNDYYVYKDGELLFIIDYDSLVLSSEETMNLYYFVKNLLWFLFLVKEEEENKPVKEVEIKIELVSKS